MDDAEPLQAVKTHRGVRLDETVASVSAPTGCLVAALLFAAIVALIGADPLARLAPILLSVAIGLSTALYVVRRRATIEIGRDGFWAETLLSSGFHSFGELRGVEVIEKVISPRVNTPEGPQPLDLWLGDDYVLVYRDGSRRRLMGAHRDLVAADIRAGIERAEGQAPCEFPPLKFSATEPRAYRDAEIRDEDLWRIVEDPHSRPSVRVSAASLLRPQLDSIGRGRLRIAAEVTAHRRVRVALEAAASNDDRAMRSALRAFEKP
jgi:hypothetical protein